MDVHEILTKIQREELSIQEGERLLKDLPYEDLQYAKLDHHRTLRRGTGEVIFCQGKAIEHLISIYEAFANRKENVLGTRASREQYEAVREKVPQVTYDPLSRILKIDQNKRELKGCAAVCSAGTADIPVAEEAAQTAEFLGSRVERYYDVGVAGIHRLFSKIEDIKKANVIVAVAGMEGALGGVLAGMVDKPVLAVPTSVGYGSSFHGLSALLTMLNTCAEGIAVLNIDNGFGAGYMASQINRLITEAGETNR